MKFYENTYYHLFSRTNNEEALFRSEENYLYFLKKYRYYLDDYLDTIGYCLMPTHFHFLVRVKEKSKRWTPPVRWSPSEVLSEESGCGSYLQGELSRVISDIIGILLSSYTKAINKRYNRHGSLFQKHTKAKPVPSDRYLITLLTYIHQNPVRSGLVEKAEEWKYSSYQDYIDLRNGTLPNKKFILGMIKKEELKNITNKSLIKNIEIKNKS